MNLNYVSIKVGNPHGPFIFVDPLSNFAGWITLLSERSLKTSRYKKLCQNIILYGVFFFILFRKVKKFYSPVARNRFEISWNVMHKIRLCWIIGFMSLAIFDTWPLLIFYLFFFCLTVLWGRGIRSFSGWKLINFSEDARTDQNLTGWD